MFSGVKLVAYRDVINFSESGAHLMHEMLRDTNAIVLDVETQAGKFVRLLCNWSTEVTNSC